MSLGPVSVHSDDRTAGPPERDVAVDLLRAIAIFEVILAHVALPAWLMQARNFGVPLLILLSGWSIGLSLAERRPRYGAYLLHRLKRVALPAWGFLAFYFLLFAVTDTLGISAARHGAATIIDSFLFGQGIGFVWVIRVNLLLALVTLPLAHLARTMGSDARFLSLVLAALAINELLFMAYVAAGGSGGMDDSLLGNTPFYLLGYGAIFAIGLRLPRLSPAMLAAAIGVAAGLFLVLAVAMEVNAGHFVPTQGFKYPPQAYYLAFALAISLSLVAARGWLVRLVPRGRASAALRFIGSHTLPIYLWHILALQIVGGLIARGLLPARYPVAFAATAAMAIAAAWLQSGLAGWIAPWRDGLRARRATAASG